MSVDAPWHRRLWSWLDDRLGLQTFGELARKKEVPLHRHSVWYYLGGMTLFLFVIQVATGFLLLFYYRPSAEQAYESIQFIMTDVQFGWLVRSIHHWAANLMVGTVFVHMFSVLLLRAYRKPRELTWLTGFGLFVVTLGLGFTGYLLPWNQLAFFATRVGTDIVGVVPVVGDFLLRLLRGGEHITGATLTRFYAIHAAVLPTLAAVLIGVHVWLVQRHGMSEPPSVEAEGGAEESVPFVPDFLLRDLVGWLGALALVAALAAYFPAELGEKANPFGSAPTGIKPEWYFMFMFQTLKYLPTHILGLEGEMVGVMGFGIGGVLLMLVPFLDRRHREGERNRVVVWLGMAVIVYMIVLTYLGYTADPTA